MVSMGGHWGYHRLLHCDIWVDNCQINCWKYGKYGALRVQSGGNGWSPSITVRSARQCKARVQDGARVQSELEV